MRQKAHHGVLNHWQVHHLDLTEEELAALRAEFGADVLPLVITGTAAGDVIRCNGGMRIRTSPLTRFEPPSDPDTEQGYCETTRSIYILNGASGYDVVPDLGNDVFARWNDPSIFYRSRLDVPSR